MQDPDGKSNCCAAVLISSSMVSGTHNTIPCFFWSLGSHGWDWNTVHFLRCTLSVFSNTSSFVNTLKVTGKPADYKSISYYPFLSLFWEDNCTPSSMSSSIFEKISIWSSKFRVRRKNERSSNMIKWERNFFFRWMCTCNGSKAEGDKFIAIYMVANY